MLHRDDRLGGEVLKQHYVLIRKRADLSPVRGDDTQQFAILAQGDHDVAVCTAKIDYGTKARVAVAVEFGIGNVVEENEILAALNSSKPTFRVGMRRNAQELGVFG